VVPQPKEVSTDFGLQKGSYTITTDAWLGGQNGIPCYSENVHILISMEKIRPKQSEIPTTRTNLSWTSKEQTNKIYMVLGTGGQPETAHPEQLCKSFKHFKRPNK
jgi:hypothetical protein